MTRFYLQHTRSARIVAILGSVTAILLLLTSAAPASATASSVRTAPYPGHAYYTQNSTFVRGCAFAHETHPILFTPSTGTALAAANTSSGGCAGILPANYSFASISHTMDYQQALSPTSTGATGAAVGVNLAWGMLLNASKGQGSYVCSAPRSSLESWYGFYQSSSGGSKWPHLIRPIVFNASTEFIWKHTYGEVGLCLSQSYISVSVWAHITERAVTIDPSSSFGQAPGHANWAASVEVWNQTNWRCSNETFWDFGKWQNTSLTCYYANETTTILGNLNGVASHRSSIASNGTTSGVIWFNHTLVTRHHPILFLYFQFAVYSYSTGWANPTASASLNLATGGKGFTLEYIAIR